jgi:hypothetical protein
LHVKANTTHAPTVIATSRLRRAACASNDPARGVGSLAGRARS